MFDYLHTPQIFLVLKGIYYCSRQSLFCRFYTGRCTEDSNYAAVYPKIVTSNLYSEHFITFICEYAHKSDLWLFHFKVNKSSFFSMGTCFVLSLHMYIFTGQRTNSRRAEKQMSQFFDPEHWVDKRSSYCFVSAISAMYLEGTILRTSVWRLMR